jgi:3-oxoacyl-[acyl-carrier protein] reductase
MGVEDNPAVAVSKAGPRLTGKTSIITGAGSGMGYATVERFLEEDGNVVALDLREDGLERLTAAHGDERLLTRSCDVTDANAVAAVVAETVERFGAVDVYFNNAGVPFVAKPMEEVSDEEWDLSMTVNLKAIFLAARIVVPQMKRQGSGSFIITASMAGMRPRPNLMPYTVSKGAAVHIAKAMAIELAPENIRVNALCPVAADTPMLAEFGAGDHITPNATPLGRLCSAEDMAAAALYLASDDSSFITGLAIPVDGGRSI